MGLAALLFAGGGAAARPVSLDDLMATEEIGQVAVDPTGRWAAIERLRPYDQAGRYDLGHAVSYARSSVWLADLAGTGPARPALSPPKGAGDTLGPFSPDGRRLAIVRLQGRSWRLGVLTLATSEVRWFDLSPELPTLGRTLQWRSPDELLVVARAPGDLPPRLRAGFALPERLTALWARAATGARPAITALGSGRLAVVSPRPPPKRLISLDVRSGHRRVWANGDIYDFELSPDGRYAALAVELEPRPPGPEPLRPATSLRRRNVQVVDLKSGALVTPCAACDLATHLLAWSPGSDEVLVYARGKDGAWGSGELLRLGRQAGAVRSVDQTVRPDLAYTPEGLPYVRADWMGPDLVVLGKTAERPRSDWWRIDPKGPINLTFRLSEAPGAILRLDDDAALFAGASGAWRIGPWAAADHLVAGRVEAIAAIEPFAGDRARVNGPPRSGISHLLAETETVRLAPGELLLHPRPASDGQLRAVSGHQLILEQRASSGTLSLIAEDPRGAHPLLRLNAFLAARTWPAVRAIRHQSPSGAVVTSWLLRPANLAADVRLPLLILPYPGLTREAPPAPYGAGQAAFRHAPAVLASCGYAVLLPSLPRSPHAEPAEGLADQILAAADAAIAAGGVDPDRIAIWGHSFGGYAALVTAAKSDRIKAVIAASAPTDLVALRGAFTPQTALFPEDGLELTAGAGWTEGGQGGLGVAPWTDPERYRRNSPLFLAPQIHAPVLLIHGDRDNVAVSQGQAMFAALWRLDHDAEFLTLWGEGHVASSPATLRAVYQRALAFLAWSLKAPPPQTSSACSQSPARPISAD